MSGLYLEKRVAEDLAKACDDLISLFRSLSDDANYLGQVGGFGTLGSARALQVKFEEKAVGGPDALVDVLASHIAVVEAMQASVSSLHRQRIGSGVVERLDFEVDRPTELSQWMCCCQSAGTRPLGPGVG